MRSIGVQRVLCGAMLKPCCRIVLVAALLLAASCTAQTMSGGTTGRRGLPADAVPVGVSSNGSHVSLDVGQVLFVELPENPSRGLTWQLASPLDQTVLMPDGQRFIESTQQQSEGSLVGTQQLRFAATGVGETIIHLALVQPGGGMSTAIERWIVQVIIR